MDISRILGIIAKLPKKTQGMVWAVIDFKAKTPQQVWQDMLDKLLEIAKAAQDREIITLYKSIPIADDIITNAFADNQVPQDKLFFSETQVVWIKEHLYRNRLAEFRLRRPEVNNEMPLDGLKEDEKVIQKALTCARRLPNGSIETFDGLDYLSGKDYRGGGYDGFDAHIGEVLQRVEIISSYETDKPLGYFVRNGRLFHNVAYGLSNVEERYVSEEGLKRAMLTMYLVSGGKINDWKAIYELIHYMVKVPNSPTGYVLYLNDFATGGNGKSKFVSILQGMFGSAFTSFDPSQLRFDIGLMGKRLVSISEFEDTENFKQLQTKVKSMTGRDTRLYEGKGADPISAASHQNFVITSNKYIYFDDPGMPRRIQNFHCNNLFYVLYNTYTKDNIYLNKLFGNVDNEEYALVMKQMWNSLLNYILKDENYYHIKLRPQQYVMGNIKNPILRALFKQNFDPENYTAELNPNGTMFALSRLDHEAKPEQLNYAAFRVIDWLPKAKLKANRENSTLTTTMDRGPFNRYLLERLHEIDQQSVSLYSKEQAYCEYGTFKEFDAKELLFEFLGETLKIAKTTEEDGGIYVN